MVKSRSAGKTGVRSRKSTKGGKDTESGKIYYTIKDLIRNTDMPGVDGEAYLKFTKKIGLDFSKATCPVIPVKTILTAMIKEYHEQDTIFTKEALDKAADIKNKFLALLLTTVVPVGYKGTMNVSNALTQLVSVEGDGKKIVLKTGSDLGVEAVCETVPFRQGLIRDDKRKNIGLLIMKSGDIAIDGKKGPSRESRGGPKLMGGESKFAYQVSKDEMTEKAQRYEELVAISEMSGKDVFVPYMAGLLSAAEEMYGGDTERLSAISTMMNSGHAHDEYVNIVGPYSENQLVSMELVGGLAPIHNTNKLNGGSYNSHRDQFKQKYAGVTNTEMKELIGGSADTIENPELKIVNIYKSVYGGSSIDPIDKLIADEIAFSANQILEGGGDMNDVATLVQLRGGSREPYFKKNNMYWNSLVGGDDESANDFFSSDYIIGAGEESHYDNAPDMPKFLQNFLAANAIEY